MDTLNIPIEELKCALCKNYLSHFPIKISSSNNNQNICGRCTQSKEDVRNVAFETVAGHLQFPCCYHKDGCVEKMFPRCVPPHEKICFYKATECPLRTYTQCSWKGPRSNQLLHCEDEHSKMFLKEAEFHLDLRIPFECRNLLVHNNVLLILTIQLNPINNTLKFSITHVEDAIVNENYFYQVFLKRDKRNIFVEEETTTFQTKTFTEVLLDSLKDPSGESSLVTGKIVLGDKKAAVNGNVNLGLLQQLQCSVCKEYAMPPIYQYGEAQEIKCSECREKEKILLSQWGGSFETGLYLTPLSSETRNFNLDKLASALNYPCKYQENGCTFVAKPEQVKKHQSLCSHRVYECPLSEYLSCNWKGSRNDMKSHIQNQHVQIIENLPEISIPINATAKTTNNKRPVVFSAHPKLETIDILSSFNQLFRINFAIKDKHYYWAVQMIYQSVEKFHYEIEIVNKNNNDKRLLARHACIPLMKKNELFAKEDHCCVFHADDFRTFLTTQKKLCFKVRITK